MFQANTQLTKILNNSIGKSNPLKQVGALGKIDGSLVNTAANQALSGIRSVAKSFLKDVSAAESLVSKSIGGMLT